MLRQDVRQPVRIDGGGGRLQNFPVASAGRDGSNGVGRRGPDGMTNLQESEFGDEPQAGSEMPPSAVEVLLRRYRLTEARQARQRRVALLTRVLQAQVLPKLALEQTAERPVHPAAALDAAEVETLTRLVLRHDDEAGFARIAAMAAAGAGVGDICLGALTPVARRLGEMWDDDLCSFVDVTAGLGALQLMLRRLRVPLEPSGAVEATRRILLAGMAGNQHTLGLRMVAEMFERADWEVVMEPNATPEGLAARAEAGWFAVVGITVAAEAQLEDLAATVRGVRLASANRAIGVLLGGPAFGADPALARRVGADVAAPDARQAVLRAEGLRVLITGA